MKKAVLAVAIMAVVSGAFASDSWKITLSTTNAIVAPSLHYNATNAWATGSIDAGAYITNSSGRAYWTPNGGTATSGQEPTHRRGISTGTDSIDWLAFKSSRRDVTIQLTQAGVDVWFIEGGDAAVSGECRLLTGKGMGWVFDGYSGELNALAGSGTATITVTEE